MTQLSPEHPQIQGCPAPRSVHSHPPVLPVPLVLVHLLVQLVLGLLLVPGYQVGPMYLGYQRPLMGQ